MSAFKAANPQSKFEDFIRWYSPKDWQASSENGKIKEKANLELFLNRKFNSILTETEGEEEFNLSARMSTSGNVWRKLWDDAMPVPACEQVSFYLQQFIINNLSII